MKKLFVLLIVNAIILGCSKDKTPKPANLIPQEKMEEILYDLNMLQAVRNSNYSLYQTENLNAGQYVYKKYNIDSLQFVQSHKYYLSNIEQYEKMLDKLLHKIDQEKKEQIAKDSLAAPKSTNDSLPPRKLNPIKIKRGSE